LVLVQTYTEPMNKVIVVEFNELAEPLLQKWIASGDLPNFDRMRKQSAVFETTADVSEDEFLEPWIQWYSVHAGIPYDEHKVFHLTDGQRAKHDDIYRVLLKAGISVSSFGSMNVRPFQGPGSAYLADPWCEHNESFPRQLTAFNRFVSSQVKEHTNPQAKLTVSDLVSFGSTMLRNGLSLTSVKQIVTQLYREKFVSATETYKRVAILDRLQLDLFSSYYEKNKPGFSTFFSNSTAHLQHAFWKYMEPSAFEFPISAKDVETYKDAIKFGYMAQDKILGEILDLAQRSQARVMFMTALSQRACPPEVINGDKSYFRFFDVSKAMESLGIRFKSCDPTMTHQYMMTFDTPDDKANALSILNQVTDLEGNSIIGINKRQSDGLYFNCIVGKPEGIDRFLLKPNVEASFKDFFYKIPATKNGRHVVTGSLWIQSPQPKVHDRAVSILDVFPTVLDFLGASSSAGSVSLKGHSLARAVGQA
jgi:hypothetical protein